MLISEIIADLERIKSEQGDLEVATYDDETDVIVVSEVNLDIDDEGGHIVVIV